MEFNILNRWTRDVQFTADIACADDAPDSIKIGLTVQRALGDGADLSEANLHGADLRGADLSLADLRGADLSLADLRGADLSLADLRGANLRGADLREANLRRADLRGADLSLANLREAYLRGANLRGADLREANLHGADLRGANLRGANLSGADLSEANLRGADLREANLHGAMAIPALAAAQSLIVPEGQIVGWKQCLGSVIVKLSIPADARRSNATGRKCRAEFADCLEVFGAESGISQHDGKTEYRTGERVICDKWEEDRWQDCAGGIHFFLTREEAEDY